MKKAQGFTLIELIIVIIILGILAVTAAPKFMDIQGDARKSVMQGVKGSLAGAVTVVYARSALQSQHKTFGGSADGVETDYGYPGTTDDALREAAGLEIADFDVTETTGSIVAASNANSTVGVAYIQPASATATTSADIELTNCYVKYTGAQLQSGGNVVKPIIAMKNSGC